MDATHAASGGTTRLIVDCDTGTDDAVAIIAAVAHPGFELVAVTTVNGNVPVEYATDNSLRVLDLLGSHVPVYGGAERPLVRDDMPIPRDVLNADDPEFRVMTLDFPPPVSAPSAKPAVEFLIDTYTRHDASDICLVAIGPLTNVALALQAAPELAARIPRLVLMGGGVAAGNVTASAEFNFWVDADAAKAVLASQLPDITIVPLDATQSVPLTIADCEAFASVGTPAGDAVAALVRHRITRDGRADGQRAPIHDPLCLAYLLDPAVATTIVNRPVEVEADGAVTLGELVVDRRPWIDADSRRHIALAADHERFMKFLLDAVRGR